LARGRALRLFSIPGPSRSTAGCASPRTLGVMNTVPLALADVDHAFRHLEFAIKLMCYAEADHIDRSKFDTDVTLLLERENVGFRANTFDTLESVVLAAQANVGVSFGVSAIVLDAALEVAGIARKPESNTPNDLLRTIVFMIRSAFAHNPAMPVWVVRGPYLRSLELELEGEAVSVSLRQLHGEVFQYCHIGGLANWFRIRRAVERVLNDAYTPSI
jgi:hypothetical protein